MSESRQTTLFGDAPEREIHRVAAHTRVLADGTEVFVAEHSRWNRGRQADPVPRPRMARVAPDPGQLGLFTPVPSAPSETPDDPR